MESTAKNKLEKETTKDMGLWDWIIRKFYVLPGHPTLDSEHSVVMTFNENMQYFPIQDEASIPLKVQIFWLLVYCLIWGVIFYTKSIKTSLHAYLLGFLMGVVIILIESYFYTNITQAVVMDQPERPYIITTPQVDPPDEDEPYDNPDKFIEWNVGVGDYKVLLGKDAPAPDRDSGYLYLANTFIEKSQNGDISSMDLEDYLIGVASPDATSALKHNRFNAGEQRGVTFFSDRIGRVSNAAYYVAVVVITWAIYVTNSQWGSTSQLAWNILSFMVAVASAGFVVDAYNIVTYNNIIYLRKRLLILAISFGITSIFVS